MSSLADRLMALFPFKQASLAGRLRQPEEPGITLSAIPRRRETGPAPLSFAQRQLWFLDQLHPGSSVYNMTKAYRLTGSLDVHALERALNEIRRRHEALRTNFDCVKEQPVQIIGPFQPVALEVEDLTYLPEDQREGACQHTLSTQARVPFNLKSDPLMRARLLRLRTDEHAILLVIHHIVSDGWSTRLLTDEIAALYEAFAQGKPSPLPPLPIQYADYASWQGDWLQGKTLESLLAYWKKHLEGSLPVLDLPTDKPRPKVQSFNGGRRSLVLPNALVKSLTALSHRHQATLFMSILAAFNTLLHRHTGQEDIIVGTPVAGRARSETQNVIGLFLNTVALRTDVSGNPTFEELLKRVRRVTVDALTYQDLPFEKLVMELQPERSLSRTPLFQVLLNMFMMAEPERYVSGVKMENLKKQEAESKYDLTLYVQAEKQDLLLDLVFNTDLFHAARMEEMLEQFKFLLEQIAETPGRPIRSYSLVTKSSRQFLPDPTVALPEPYFAPVASELLSWVKKTPTQHAVVQADRAWSYDELSRSAQALAGTLMAHGLKRAEVVAVTGPRSFGLIGSILGVVMSGGVVLMIDRNLPANRQRLMLSEARARHLLYVGEWRQEDNWLRELEDLQIIRVTKQDGDALSGDTILPFGESSLPQISPDDAAYIFFTSGTTGVPRGVLGRHKGLSHFLTWQKHTFTIGPGDRCAQLTNLSFDVVLRDIFLPLVSGATLCLPDENLDPASDGVLAWMERQEITVFHAVPTLAQSWLGMPHGGVSLRTLRWAFFAGEALAEVFVRRWRNAFPQAGGIVNLYGPTETTLVKCFHVIPDEPSHGVQPIGKPLPHSQALVLMENGQLCGVGESGEIVLRTPFRTLGYINSPEEQRKRFVTNPFCDDPRDQVYYTGDKGRYRADGTLEILGRLDDQVKVRGVRVEPDEITAILGQHPRVAAGFVAARKDQQGDSVLVAYVVPFFTNAVTVGDLRSYLGTHLPAAMVPSAFVFLEALPLTPNGKVNRRALPEPDPVKPELDTTFVPPRTPIESILAGIVADVLGLARVGTCDNFFELGGHSLLATRVISRISGTFRVDLPLRTLFETPTVAALAAGVADRLAQGPERPTQERLLAELERLSEAEADRLLADARAEGREEPHE